MKRDVDLLSKTMNLDISYILEKEKKSKDLLKNMYKRARKLRDTAIPRLGSTAKANSKPSPPHSSKVRNTMSHEN